MLRSINNAHELLLKDDPNTAVTVYTIRMWCKQGKIRYLTAGTKILVDMDSLLNYISNTN